MADISRLKKSRSANRNVLKGLVVKAKDAGARESNEKNQQEISSILKTIAVKQKVVAELDAKILEVIEEDKIDEDVELGTDFEVKLTTDIAQIEKLLEVKKEPVDVPKQEQSALMKTGVKLPKICIKKFYGDPTLWQQFYETFEATVHNNRALSCIEKFSYLKGYLGAAAEKSIEVLT